MSSALFLGSGGRVGQLLQAAWTGPVKSFWHQRHGGDISFDILNDTDALTRAITQCDVIVSLAGATHHGTQDVADTNARLAHVLDNAGNRPVFLMSSAAVYGAQSGTLSETTPPEPVTPYGHDKVAMEAIAIAHPAKSIILRIGNVAGADALLGVDRDIYDLDMFEDGSYPCRSYISPVQLAHVLSTLIEARETLPKVLNIATPNAVSMADLLSAAGKSWRNKPAGPNAIAKVELDTNSLQNLVNLPCNSSQAETIVADLKSLTGAT